jgi:hypothetical protein
MESPYDKTLKVAIYKARRGSQLGEAQKAVDLEHTTGAGYLSDDTGKLTTIAALLDLLVECASRGVAKPPSGKRK